MPQSKSEQTRQRKNSIEQSRPNIEYTREVPIEGFFANSWNAGHDKPIAYAPVFKNTRCKRFEFEIDQRMLTPAQPIPQRMSTYVTLVFVPNTRVWDGANEFKAHKEGAIEEIPSTNIPIYTIDAPDQSKSRPVTDLTQFRDNYFNCYFPRLFTGEHGQKQTGITSAKYNFLPARGGRAIYNDILRNKAYDEKLQEWTGNTITEGELNATFRQIGYSNKFTAPLRGRRKNSYYTDNRTKLGEKTQMSMGPDANNWNYEELIKKVAEARTQALNEQKSDWEIIADITGGRPATQGECVILGTAEIPINYTQVVQTSNSANAEVTPEQQAMGQTGAYSWTRMTTNLAGFYEPIEDGYVHAIVHTSADSVFETGIHRSNLNVKFDDLYNPDKREEIDDVMYEQEIGMVNANPTKLKTLTPIAFKRKFNEDLTIPNCIGGDVTNMPYYDVKSDGKIGDKIETKQEYTLFETAADAEYIKITDGSYKKVAKNWWQDYTDLRINENQKVKNEVETYTSNGKSYIEIKGPNQIFAVGRLTIYAELPINPDIENNRLKWGEV